MTNTVESAVRTGNFELLDEYFEANKISQDLLNECLNVAVYADDPYESMLYLLGKGADPNNDNIIWDLAYNARVEAMRALLTSDDVDLTEKMKLVMTLCIWRLRMRVAVQNTEIIKLLNY